MYIFGTVIVVMGFLIMMERLYPHYKLPKVKNWYLWVIILNGIQLFVAFIGHYIWETKYDGFSLVKFNMSSYPVVNGFYTYIIITWIFYWWHYIRHESEFLWLLLHQVHHSPTRIEILTSFYKHPLEVISNSIIMTILSNFILGLDMEASAWATMFSAFGEFFYHVNIKTPYILGFFVQRPESHRIHHIQDRRHCKNYSDLPFWDMLNETFENPKDGKMISTGFSEEREQLIGSILLGKNVINGKSLLSFITVKNILLCLLLLIGLTSSIGHITNNGKIKGLGFASGASPLPLVFSVYNDIETFSTTFDIEATLLNDTVIQINLNKDNYGLLKGPYNRRNVFGAVFSHGPFFNMDTMIKLRQRILYYGFCEKRVLIKEFGYDEYVKSVHITVKSKTVGNEGKVWTMSVRC